MFICVSVNVKRCNSLGWMIGWAFLLIVYNSAILLQKILTCGDNHIILLALNIYIVMLIFKTNLIYIYSLRGSEQPLPPINCSPVKVYTNLWLKIFNTKNIVFHSHCILFCIYYGFCKPSFQSNFYQRHCETLNAIITH